MSQEERKSLKSKDLLAWIKTEQSRFVIEATNYFNQDQINKLDSLMLVAMNQGRLDIAAALGAVLYNFKNQEEFDAKSPNPLFTGDIDLTGVIGDLSEFTHSVLIQLQFAEIKEDSPAEGVKQTDAPAELPTLPVAPALDFKGPFVPTRIQQGEPDGAARPQPIDEEVTPEEKLNRAIENWIDKNKADTPDRVPQSRLVKFLSDAGSKTNISAFQKPFEIEPMNYEKAGLNDKDKEEYKKLNNFYTFEQVRRLLRILVKREKTTLITVEYLEQFEKKTK